MRPRLACRPNVTGFYFSNTEWQHGLPNSASDLVSNYRLGLPSDSVRKVCLRLGFRFVLLIRFPNSFSDHGFFCNTNKGDPGWGGVQEKPGVPFLLSRLMELLLMPLSLKVLHQRSKYQLVNLMSDLNGEPAFVELSSLGQSKNVLS